MSKNRSSTGEQLHTQTFGWILAISITLLACIAIYNVILGAHEQMVETVALNGSALFSR